MRVMEDSAAGAAIAAPAPCKKRMAMMMSAFHAKPAISDAPLNTPMPSMKSLRRP